MGERRRSRVLPEDHVLHLPPPPPQTAPGLDVLAATSRLFTVEQSEPLNLVGLKGKKTKKYLKVYDGDGQHIFSVAEVSHGIFPAWQVFIYIYSIRGDPLVTIVQRATGPSAWNYTDQQAPLYFQADRIISTYYGQKNKGIVGKYEEPSSWIHVADARGGFLGHYWESSHFPVILDANLTPTLRLQGRNAHQGSTNEGTEGKSEDDEAHISYFIMEGKQRIGSLSAYSPSSNFGVDLPHPYAHAAHFPHEFTQVDKLLILAFLLYKQTSSSARNHFVISTILFLCVLLTVLLSLVGLTLALLFRFKHVNPP